jgi:hypothetical protein
MERVRYKLGFENMFVVDSVGKSGGLALLWKTEVGAVIQNYSRRHINAIVNYPTSHPPWKLTGFYGQPEASKRGEAWDLLKYISRMEPKPWICFGDFNEIVSLSEKWGVNGRQRGLMEAFQKTLEECSLSDLDYRGPKYTWTNCRDGNQFTKEQLDRAIANQQWRDFFREVDVFIGAALSSDHSPIVINLDGGEVGQQHQRRFRYEAHWEIDKKCHDIIAQAWEDWGATADPWQNITRRIERCKKGLYKWQAVEVRHPKRALEEKIKKLSELQGMDENPDREHVVQLKKEIHGLLEKDEWRWKQRSKVEWLKHGDKNSKFFFACANQRRSMNRIRTIEDEMGRTAETQKEIGNVFVEYFFYFI